MNDAFVSGFIKAARAYGFSTEEALDLIKSAGRGAVLKGMFQGAEAFANKIPGIAKAAPKAYDKMMNTADTLKGMVGSTGIAERGSLAATQQGDMARLLRSRMKALKPAPAAPASPVPQLAAPGAPIVPRSNPLVAAP